MDEIQAARKALVAFGYYVRGKFSHSGLMGEQFVETMCWNNVLKQCVETMCWNNVLKKFSDFIVMFFLKPF